MERNLSSLKFDSDTQTLIETHENSKCVTCGEEFEQPLYTVISSGYVTEEYYACPRCLSKVGGVERRKTVEAEEPDEEDNQSGETEVEIKMEKMEETVACPHYLGYLKKRQKNTPIPEGCLTCGKMIDCMSY
jgi:DNA-directed RNA polymerase subunit RPC12/RpoP